MTKLRHLTKLYHHTLYHVSHVVVRWRRTVPRRRRAFRAVLHRRRTQILPWRTSSYDAYVVVGLAISIIVGLCYGLCLSHDYLCQRRTGPTTAYIDVRRCRTLPGVLGLVLRFLNMFKTSYDNLRLGISPASTCVGVHRRRTRSSLSVVDLFLVWCDRGFTYDIAFEWFPEVRLCFNYQSVTGWIRKDFLRT